MSSGIRRWRAGNTKVADQNPLGSEKTVRDPYTPEFNLPFKKLERRYLKDKRLTSDEAS